MLNAPSLKGEIIEGGGPAPKKEKKNYQNQIGRDCHKIAVFTFIFCPPQGLSAYHYGSDLPK